MPDQICQSVWWNLTDHQLKPIKPASNQWNSRTGRSQTGAFTRRSLLFAAIGVVAGLAGFAEIVESRLDDSHVARPRGGVKGCRGLLKCPVPGDEIRRLLPDFLLGPRLANIRSRNSISARLRSRIAAFPSSRIDRRRS